MHDPIGSSIHVQRRLLSETGTTRVVTFGHSNSSHPLRRLAPWPPPSSSPFPSSEPSSHSMPICPKGEPVPWSFRAFFSGMAHLGTALCIILLGRFVATASLYLGRCTGKQRRVAWPRNKPGLRGRPSRILCPWLGKPKISLKQVSQPGSEPKYRDAIAPDWRERIERAAPPPGLTLNPVPHGPSRRRSDPRHRLWKRGRQAQLAGRLQDRWEAPAARPFFCKFTAAAGPSGTNTSKRFH